MACRSADRTSETFCSECVANVCLLDQCGCEVAVNAHNVFRFASAGQRGTAGPQEGGTSHAKSRVINCLCSALTAVPGGLLVAELSFSFCF